MRDYKKFTCSNAFATLSHHRDSLRGVILDYKIRFNQQEQAVEDVIECASSLVKQLIDTFHREDRTVKGSLVAAVRYIRATTEEEVTYFHRSYSSEVISDADDFFVTHMIKVGERLTTHIQNGSNLMIKAIEEIHVRLSVQN